METERGTEQVQPAMALSRPLLVYRVIKQYQQEGLFMPGTIPLTLEAFVHQTVVDILDHAPAAELRKRLSLAERLEGLSPQERMSGLSVEERLRGLTAEQILAALPPEIRKTLQQQPKDNTSPGSPP